jgi:hypothetical protein
MGICRRAYEERVARLRNRTAVKTP